MFIRLESELGEVKQKKAGVQNVLKSSSREPLKPNQLGKMPIQVINVQCKM